MNRKKNFDKNGWLLNCIHKPSPNFNFRPKSIKEFIIVIHSISLPPGQYKNNHIEDFFLNKLDIKQDPYFETIVNLKVSAHFLIKRNGETLQFVSCIDRAWHAGKSEWQGKTNCNDFSIGIELEGSENEGFDEEQYDKLLKLINCLKEDYKILDIVGHSDIAPGRKTDPGKYFNWVKIK